MKHFQWYDFCEKVYKFAIRAIASLTILIQMCNMPSVEIEIAQLHHVRSQS